MSCPAERVVAFRNKRGTCEPWIKECIAAQLDRGRSQRLLQQNLGIRCYRFEVIFAQHFEVIFAQHRA
jgi:hypothetical protein